MLHGPYSSMYNEGLVALALYRPTCWVDVPGLDLWLVALCRNCRLTRCSTTALSIVGGLIRPLRSFAFSNGLDREKKLTTIMKSSCTGHKKRVAWTTRKGLSYVPGRWMQRSVLLCRLACTASTWGSVWQLLRDFSINCVAQISHKCFPLD